MHHTAPRRSLVVIPIVTIPIERWVRAGRQYRRTNHSAQLIVHERAQKPAPARIRGFHFQRAIGFTGMPDDLMRDQGVEMRIGHDHDFALGRLEDRRRSKLLRFPGEFDGKSTQGWVRHQLAAPSFFEALEASLLADGVVAFLVAIAVLRDYVAIALRECEALRDRAAGSVEK